MWCLVEGGGYSRAYRKSSIKAPHSNEPPSLISPPFQRRKINKPSLSIKPPPPHAPPRIFILHKKIKEERGQSVKIYSGWKSILVLVFGGMTSNFICFTFSILRSSSLWRIAAIFLSLDKAATAREPQVRPRETLLLSVKILSCNRHEIKIYTAEMIIFYRQMSNYFSILRTAGRQAVNVN